MGFEIELKLLLFIVLAENKKQMAPNWKIFKEFNFC